MRHDRNGGSETHKQPSAQGKQGIWSPGRPLPLPPVQIPARPRRRTVPWLIAAIVAILLSAGAVYGTQHQHDARPVAPGRDGTAVPERDARSPHAAAPTRTATSSGVPSAPLRQSSGAPSPGVSRAPAAGGSDGGTAKIIESMEGLTVKGRAPTTGYDRDLFGQAWSDVDRNGCDTRNDILRRDLDDITIKAGSSGCTVMTGTLSDPYSGQPIAFVRGGETSGLVQIDHVVALADAWQSGARTWSSERREEFANDPLNLLAVPGYLNQQKGASNAASWLPPARSSWCGYATQQVLVKQRYGLSVTSSERDALRRSLEMCVSYQTLAPPGDVPVATH